MPCVIQKEVVKVCQLVESSGSMPRRDTDSSNKMMVMTYLFITRRSQATDIVP